MALLDRLSRSALVDLGENTSPLKRNAAEAPRRRGYDIGGAEAGRYRFYAATATAYFAPSACRAVVLDLISRYRRAYLISPHLPGDGGASRRAFSLLK